MSGGTARIYLVDDDPDIHLAVTMILESVGYEVTCFQSAADGLAAMKASPPDLALLDIMLSHPTAGLELACQMRQVPELAQTPIILVSSIGSTIGLESADACCSVDIAAERFIEKPFDAKTLRTAVAEVLAGTG